MLAYPSPAAYGSSVAAPAPAARLVSSFLFPMSVNETLFAPSTVRLFGRVLIRSAQLLGDLAGVPWSLGVRQADRRCLHPLVRQG